MSFPILRREEKLTGPVPASGVHAELLAEIVVLNTTRRLVALAERRASELRDAGRI